MKRIALRALLFLLLGAVINVAVAWGALWAAPWDGLQLQTGPPEQTNWPRQLPEGWPATCTKKVRECPGLIVQMFYEFGASIVDDDGRRHESHIFAGTTTESGWPLGSLGTGSWTEFVQSSSLGPTPQFSKSEVPLEDTVWARGIDVSHSLAPTSRHRWKRLPVRPLWPGFAADTLLYAALMACLFALPRAARRWRRVRRAQCIHCGYPVGGSVTCSECGRPVKPREGARA